MSIDSLPPDRSATLLWQSVVPVTAAVIVVLVASQIPLPGIDTSVLSEQAIYSPNGALARFSIFALGVMPLFTVLAHVEIAKLIFPSLARCQIASSGNAFRISVVIKFIVLLLTAIQGYGMMSALAAMDVVDGSPGATSVGIVSFVGTTAVLIWLNDMARFPNLGNGVWLLLAIPLLGALPLDFVTSIELARFGAVPAMDWLIATPVILLAVWMIVVANALLSGKGGEAAPTLSLTVLLWPPFLASTVAGYLFIVPLVFAPELFSDTPWLLNLAALALSTILVPLFVYGYYRLISIVQPEIACGEIRSILVVVAGVQILVCIGMGILKQATSFSFIPSGGMLIVCVTVMLALRWSLGGRSLVGT
ncbi:preprotein translocase subunit SecY [Brucella pecoris]|nr:preprotein translocase subunit SecY [Brucella pecoris]MBB4096021.1 preprotein translocase subunit SecY [Brucella pecoris]